MSSHKDIALLTSSVWRSQASRYPGQENNDQQLHVRLSGLQQKISHQGCIVNHMTSLDDYKSTACTVCGAGWVGLMNNIYHIMTFHCQYIIWNGIDNNAIALTVCSYISIIITKKNLILNACKLNLNGASLTCQWCHHQINISCLITNTSLEHKV